MGLRIDDAKGQVAMEFVFLVVFTFLIFLIFGIVIREQVVSLGQKEEETMLKDVVGMVQQEINTAISVSDGYRRTFSTPESLNSKDYNLTIINDYLGGEMENYETLVKIPHVEGSVAKGNNTISKEGGVVFLN